MAEHCANSTVTIRPFAQKDWHALWLVHLGQLAEHGVFLDPSEIGDGPDPDVGDEAGEWDLEHPEEVYLRGAGNFWLAWDGDLPIGFIGGMDIGGVIELRRMYVRADYRLRGIGTALVRSLIAHSQAHGIRVIELWTDPDGAGPRFYPMLGFRQTAGLGPEFSAENPTLHRYMSDKDMMRMRLDL